MPKATTEEINEILSHQPNDFYGILGLPHDANDNEIYESYIKLYNKYHQRNYPFGKCPSEIEKASKMIDDAYRVLSNPEIKEKYDQELAELTKEFEESEKLAKQIHDSLTNENFYFNNLLNDIIMKLSRENAVERNANELTEKKSFSFDKKEITTAKEQKQQADILTKKSIKPLAKLANACMLYVIEGREQHISDDELTRQLKKVIIQWSHNIIHLALQEKTSENKLLEIIKDAGNEIKENEQQAENWIKKIISLAEPYDGKNKEKVVNVVYAAQNLVDWDKKYPENKKTGRKSYSKFQQTLNEAKSLGIKKLNWKNVTSAFLFFIPNLLRLPTKRPFWFAGKRKGAGKIQELTETAENKEILDQLKGSYLEQDKVIAQRSEMQ